MEVRDKILNYWANRLNISKNNEALVKLLEHYETVELVRPFVVEDLIKGVGRPIILDRYGITAGQMRGIGIKAGIFKPKRF